MEKTNEERERWLVNLCHGVNADVEMFEKSWQPQPAIIQVPQSSVRTKIDDPANRPTPVNTNSSAISFELRSPEAVKSENPYIQNIVYIFINSWDYSNI